MDVQHVADAVLYMAPAFPLSANVQFMTPHGHEDALHRPGMRDG